MMIQTAPATDNARRSGFSLIEVLIAILVLATGLLALAALQTRVVRESADARARSQVASFSQAVLEEWRAGGYDAIPVGSDVSLTTNAELAALATRAGVSNLQEDTVVAHYVGSAGDFTRHTSLQTVSANAPQYKQVEFGLSWTDASGASRTLDMVTAVSPLSLSSSGLLVTRPLSGFTSSRPIVRRETPEGAGIIPIALADGSETAATNPRPKLGGNRDDTLVSDTRYEVLTYSEYTEGGVQLARIQERVETAIVGCKCRSDTTGFDTDLAGLLSAAAFRPTYWDGTRYREPEVAEYAATSSQEPNGNGNNAFVQSELCDVCCRDHKDPSGVQGPKFDPLREVHEHCASIEVVDGVATCVGPGEGDLYLEACRAIRVDGVFRIAADANLEHMSLIPTDSSATVPGITGAQDEYEDFVLAYMASRFPDSTEPTNSPVEASAAETMVEAAGLNEPALLTLSGSSIPADLRWLHTRGLYIDFLEEDARQEIEQAWEDCELTGADKIKCVLPFVPFSAVNMTDIAEWDEATDSGLLWIDVSNASGTVFGDPEDPVRGRSRVNPAVSLPGTTLPYNYAVPAARQSNSTLARYTPVDPDDAVVAETDEQAFEVRAGVVPPPSTGVRFDVSLLSHSRVGDGDEEGPKVSLVTSGGILECETAASDSNPYECTSDIDTNVELTVTEYNVGPVEINTNVSNPCGNGNVKSNVCYYFPITGVMHNATAITPTYSNTGAFDETAQFTLPTVADDDAVTVTFGTPTQGNAQAVCDLVTSNKPIRWECP